MAEYFEVGVKTSEVLLVSTIFPTSEDGARRTSAAAAARPPPTSSRRPETVDGGFDAVRKGPYTLNPKPYTLKCKP